MARIDRRAAAVMAGLLLPPAFWSRSEVAASSAGTVCTAESSVTLEEDGPGVEPAAIGSGAAVSPTIARDALLFVCTRSSVFATANSCRRLDSWLCRSPLREDSSVTRLVSFSLSSSHSIIYDVGE